MIVASLPIAAATVVIHRVFDKHAADVVRLLFRPNGAQTAASIYARYGLSSTLLIGVALAVCYAYRRCQRRQEQRPILTHRSPSMNHLAPSSRRTIMRTTLPSLKRLRDTRRPVYVESVFNLAADSTSMPPPPRYPRTSRPLVVVHHQSDSDDPSFLPAIAFPPGNAPPTSESLLQLRPESQVSVQDQEYLRESAEHNTEPLAEPSSNSTVNASDADGDVSEACQANTSYSTTLTDMSAVMAKMRTRARRSRATRFSWVKNSRKRRCQAQARKAEALAAHNDNDVADI